MILRQAHKFAPIALSAAATLLAVWLAARHLTPLIPRIARSYQPSNLVLLTPVVALSVWAGLHAAKRLNADQDGAARLRTLAESIPQIVWMADANGRVTHINQRWYEMIGTRGKEVCGLDRLESIHPDDRAPFRKNGRNAC